MFTRFTINIKSSGKPRTDYLEGRECYVVPTSILPVEGVVPGSLGPILYPEKENVRTVNAWNHKPILVYHPEKEGQNVSGCDPVILSTRKIGVILNTKRGKTITTESWIDKLRTRAVDKRVLEKVEKGEPVEVSTGVFLDVVQTPGKYNDEDYVGVAHNIQPDHLAALPDQVGAFSVEKGGGMFMALNAGRQPEGVLTVIGRSVENALKALDVTLAGNELSFSQKTRQLCDLLSAKFGEPGKYWEGYVVDTFDDYVVYSYDGKLWKINYVTDGEEVALDGEAEEVQRKVEYAAASSAVTNQGEGVVMDKKKVVDGLIAANCGWAEADRPLLMGMADEQLTRHAARAPAPANNQQQPAGAPGPQMSVNQYLQQAPPEIAAALGDVIRAGQAERQRLVGVIMANAQNKFSKEYLESTAVSIDMLRGIAAIAEQPAVLGLNANPAAGVPMFQANAQPQPNYYGAAGFAPPQLAANGVPQDTFLPTPTMEFESPVK